MIKAVFVDLGGVLVLNKAQEVYEDFERRYGIKGETIKDIFKFLHSDIRSKEDLLSYLKTQQVSPEVWEEFTGKFHDSEKRNDTLVNILYEAKNRGLKIIYTSNNSAGLEKVLDKYSLTQLPHVVVNSSLANVAKPDPAFWKVALVEAKKEVPGIAKSEILVIDDSKTNFDSAIDFGFKAFQYSEAINDQIAESLK